MILHEKMAAQLPAWRERVKSLVKEHGETVVDQVTIGQVYGGMRDIKSMVTDVSFVDPATGIKFRGMAIPEVLAKLPKPRGAKIPYVGGLYYLLMTGEIPNRAQAEEVEKEWAARAVVPDYVFKMIRSMPKETHPMVLLSQAVLALESGSKFAKAYHDGVKKDAYWESTLEDSPGSDCQIAGHRRFYLSSQIFQRNEKTQIQRPPGLWDEFRPHDGCGRSQGLC